MRVVCEFHGSYRLQFDGWVWMMDAFWGQGFPDGVWKLWAPAVALGQARWLSRSMGAIDSVSHSSDPEQ